MRDLQRRAHAIQKIDLRDSSLGQYLPYHAKIVLGYCPWGWVISEIRKYVLSWYRGRTMDRSNGTCIKTSICHDQNDYLSEPLLRLLSQSPRITAVHRQIVLDVTRTVLTPRPHYNMAAFSFTPGPYTPTSSKLVALLLLFSSCLSSATLGYDGSMMSALNILPSYTDYFHLTPATLALNTATVYI